MNVPILRLDGLTPWPLSQEILLLRHGRAAQCLRECRDFFAPMARLTGTLWENLSPEASLNHGFASSAAWLIHRALAKRPKRDAGRTAC